MLTNNPAELPIKRQIDYLFRLAYEAWNAGKYSSAEKLYEECVSLGKSDLGNYRLVEGLYWLGVAKNTLGKFQESVTLSTQIINLGTDSEKKTLFNNVNDLIFVVAAYTSFVTAARNLGEISNSQVLEVISSGFLFLEDIGHEEWGGLLHFHRGSILFSNGKYLDAIQEYDTALALRSRSPATLTYTTSSYKRAKSLALYYSGDTSKAIETLQEIFQDTSTNTRDKCLSHNQMVDIALAQKQYGLALESAQEAVNNALLLEADLTKEEAFRKLTSVLVATGQIEDAIPTAAQALRYSKKSKSHAYNASTFLVCADVRIAQLEKISASTPNFDTIKIIKQSLRFIEHTLPMEHYSFRGNPSGHSSGIPSRLEKLIQFMQVFGHNRESLIDEVLHIIKVLESTSTINLHESYRALGDIYLRYQYLQKSLSAYLNGMNFRKDCLYCQGKVLMNLALIGDLEEAKKKLEEYKASSDSPYFQYIEGTLRMLEGDEDGGLDIFNNALTNNPQFLDNLLEYQEKLPLPTRLATKDLRMPFAHDLMNKYGNQLGLSEDEISETIELIQALFSMDSEYISTFLRSLIAQDETSTLDLMALAFPENSEMAMYLAEAYLEANELDKAALHFGSIARKTDNTTIKGRALYRLAQVNEYMGKLGDAEKHYLDLVSIWSNKEELIPVHIKLANIAITAQNFSLALEYLDKTQPFDDSSEFAPDIYRTYGTIYLDQKNYEGALQSYSKAIQLDPDHPYTHYNIATAYEELEHYKEARFEYLERIKLSPDDALGAYYRLGMLDSKDGNRDSGRKYFRQVRNICKKGAAQNLYASKSFYNQLFGISLIVLGDYDEAEKLLHSVIMDEKTDYDLHQGLENDLEILRKIYRSKKLRQLCEKLLKINSLQIQKKYSKKEAG